eukprot:SAG31_NODE_37512_length_303_cov_1.504902_1_plen_48_part_10
MTRDDFRPWTGIDSLTGVEVTSSAAQDVGPVWDSMLAYAANLPQPQLP